MAMNDWNHNGKDDAFDNFIDYKLSGGDSGSSGGRRYGGGMSTFGVILCVLSGLVEEAVLFTALDIEVDDVPAFILVALWIFGSFITAIVVTSIKK